MDIQTAINQLFETLINTREFNNLRTAIRTVQSNPELKRRLDDFNAKQRSVYEGRRDQAQVQIMMSEIEGDYRNLMNIPQVKTYFDANEAFGEVVSAAVEKLHKMIGVTLDNR